MRSGKLDRTLIFQRLTRTVSPAGSVTEAWADFATARAELVSNSVTESGTAFGEADDGRCGPSWQVLYSHGSA